LKMKVKVKNGSERRALLQFKKYVRSQGLKWTQQRELIGSLFLSKRCHLSAQEVYDEVRKKDSRVGYSTVYRTLKLAVDAGLVSERRFGPDETLFEPATEEKHHDHLICKKCGRIIEFENAKIEDLQKEVAREKNFEIRERRLVLYGYCSKCHQRRRRQ